MKIHAPRSGTVRNIQSAGVSLFPPFIISLCTAVFQTTHPSTQPFARRTPVRYDKTGIGDAYLKIKIDLTLLHLNNGLRAWGLSHVFESEEGPAPAPQISRQHRFLCADRLQPRA